MATKPGKVKVATILAPPPPEKKTGAQFEWEATLANLLNVPYSKNVKRFFDAWHTADNSSASNNPFNITVDYTGKATESINSVGVKSYPTALDGLNATAKFILKNTPDLLGYISGGDFKGASDYLQNAHWAGGSTTYGASVYRNYQNSAYTVGNNAPTKLSAKDKAQVSTLAATYKAQAEAGSQSYLDSQTQLGLAKAQGQEQISLYKQELALSDRHNDPWVVENLDKTGQVTSFTPAYGVNPPKETKTSRPFEHAGEPITYKQLSDLWDSRYAGVYNDFTGKDATPQQISQIVQSGINVFALRGQLANSKGFTSSPIYKASAAGLREAAKPILGVDAPETLVKQALAENWDSATYQAHLRSLPAYTKGPEFQTNVADMRTIYQSIYGNPGKDALQTIQETAANGWTPNEFGQYLRTQPQYKTSLEYQAKATSFLEQMGLLTGSRPILTPSAGVKGGTAVPNSDLIPGSPKSLVSPLPFKASLPGSGALLNG